MKDEAAWADVSQVQASNAESVLQQSPGLATIGSQPWVRRHGRAGTLKEFPRTLRTFENLRLDRTPWRTLSEFHRNWWRITQGWLPLVANPGLCWRTLSAFDACTCETSAHAASSFILHPSSFVLGPEIFLRFPLCPLCLRLRRSQCLPLAVRSSTCPKPAYAGVVLNLGDAATKRSTPTHCRPELACTYFWGERPTCEAFAS